VTASRLLRSPECARLGPCLAVTFLLALLLPGCSSSGDKGKTAGDRAASNAASAEAEAAARSGRMADAETAWQRAIGLDPENPAPYASRARLRWAQRQFKGAAEDFAEASRRDPKSAELVLAEIQVRQDGGDERRTEELARRALALEPDNPKAMVYLGRYLSRLSSKPGAQQEARRLLERAAQLAPTMPIPLVELGSLLQRQGEAAAAETYLETAWQLLHVAGRPLRQLESMAMVEARRAETAYALALCKRALGKTQDAATWFKRFREVDGRIDRRSRLAPLSQGNPPDKEALIALAELDVQTGGAAEAVPLVRRGLELWPDDRRLRALVDRLKRIRPDD
jgi:tetratricopeptide (TPR) repeat protein